MSRFRNAAPSLGGHRLSKQMCHQATYLFPCDNVEVCHIAFFFTLSGLKSFSYAILRGTWSTGKL